VSAIAGLLVLPCYRPLLVCVTCMCVLGLGSSDEMRLIEDLFTKQAYNPLIRPVRNLTGTVHVKFGTSSSQSNGHCACQVWYGDDSAY